MTASADTETECSVISRFRNLNLNAPKIVKFQYYI